MIALTGATGALGSLVVARLLADGHHDLRLLLRDASRLNPGRDAEIAPVKGYTDGHGPRAG